MANIRVSNQSQLTNALNNVRSGDTILLASGTYSKLEMSSNWRKDFDFSSKVTIKSENVNNPAVINRVYLNDASNIEISDIRMDYTGSTPSGTPGWLRTKPFTLQNTSNVTFDDITFNGDNNSAGYGNGTGLYVKQSSGFTLKDSDMSNFHTAINVWNSSDIELSDNNIRQMNHDGIFLGGINGINIEGNFIGNYRPQYPSAQHKDNIQFYTGSGSGPSEDIVIRGNTLDSSDYRHGVFIFNEMYRAGNMSARHENILIENNYIHTTNVHGITVTHADDVIIRNNTVVHNDDRGFSQIPLINVSLLSRNIDIIGNTVYSVQNEANSSWDVRGNIVQAHSRAHWDGVYRNGQLVENTSSFFAESASTLSMVDQDADVFSIDADSFDSGTPQIIQNLDFTSDDRLVLSGFGSDTFSGDGVTISENGGAVSITSAEGLRNVVLQAEDVTARASADGDDLFVYIAHDKDLAVLALVDYLV